jgi:hypothetical protein
LPLEILKNYVRELHMFGLPLGLRKDDPIQRTLGALLQGQGEKRLGMPHESHFTRRKSQSFPNQTHQPIAVSAAARIAVSAGGENQADLLQRSNAGRNHTRHLIGKRFHQQGMPWIQIVVVNGELWIRAARFTDGVSQSLALQQIEIERHRKYEHFPGLDCIQWQRIYRGQRNHRPETENFFRSIRDREHLLRRFAPRRVSGMKIRSKDECRAQFSFPPIRPCLVMAASTSTIARTATRAVMSEIS